MIFGFSLYTASLLVTLVIYFRSVLGELSRLKSSEGSEVCCHQH